MGGHEDWGQPSGITPNGLLPSPESGVTQVLDAERWAIVEARTAELIARIQPNKPSEDRRNAVANYVQQLITKCFSCQVFTFGSVPLKTYLPDGDIDLTAFSKNVDLKDTWANEVKEALENEERSENAEFRVKEVQYIQAEVKIIKCLVENIVVDISFNQLGGLCTLCFLEEIDHLINQDHLFKRSIILIKAWCYYESRILGAHHGLISTYALETLVLYIFHVFNNSFKGPLEVLYRFLEFFSKFDWENFCVSLWGPVPIHSLPDMTAEPPRKDSGELLLSQIFLNACSSVYAVFPHGHENQGQPFVSKHFNVIDPLRTNNNLGRSVSKGNFYRIRSAFAFGAKRLAGLLECSKEHMISEIDKFFMNTWKRHGSGIRPDAPDIVLSSLQPSSVDPFRGPDSLNNHATNKNIIKNVGLRTTEECLGNGPVAINGITQPANIINQTTRNISRTSSSSSQNEKNNARQASSKIPDHIGRSVSSSQAMQTEKCQANPSANYSSNDYSGQGRFQFARTHSSPELSDSSADILSHGRRNIAVEIVKNHLTSERPDRSGRKKNFGIDIPGAMRSNIDPSSPIYSSCHQISSTAADSNCDSNSYHDDTGFSASREELTSVSHTLEMHQEEQDLINMMAAPRVNFNGMVPVPINIASHHLPVPPPMLPSMGFSQKNVGVFPPNMPIVEPPWGSNLQFHQGPVTSPLTNYFPNARIESNPEGMMESGNESSGMSDINQEDGDHGIWPDEDAVSSVGFVPDDRNFQMLNSNDKKVHHLGGFGFIPIPQAPNSNTTFVRDQPKFGRENKSLERERQTDASVFQNTRETDSYSCNRSADLRLTHASHSTSRNISSESWDSQTMKSSKSERDKRGSKLVPSAVSTPIYGKTKSWGHYEDSSLDHNSVPTDNDIEDWIQKSASGSEMAEQNSDVSSLASASHQSTGHDPALMSGPDSVFPRMIVCAAPGQGPGNSNGMGPFTHFYPTGPPVPFYMFPCYKVPSESGNPEGLLEQFNGLDMNHLKSSMSNLDLEGRSEHPENPIASNSMQGVSSELPEEHKSDILNGDFSSHWQNLQYGRLCQGTNVQGPPVYPVPIQMVPPMYLQGHFPWDGPGRPFPANANVFAPVVRHGQRLLQVMPVHPGSIRHTDVYQRHGDEMPRYRSGTGTYLPKTKVPYRDKQASSTRNRRGGYNPERNEQGDREGSWISSKSRVSGRSHGRGQYDRLSTRPDRLPNTDNRTDRSWDSHKHERISSSHQNSYLSPTNSNQGSASVSYSMYPLSSASSNTVNPTSAAVPSVMMLYSYDPSLGYGSSSEQVEFGSLGPMHLSGLNEVPQPNNGGAARNVFEHRRDAYQQGSSCSSPEQPSSPQIQRRR